MYDYDVTKAGGKQQGLGGLEALSYYQINRPPMTFAPPRIAFAVVVVAKAPSFQGGQAWSLNGSVWLAHLSIIEMQPACTRSN